MPESVSHSVAGRGADPDHDQVGGDLGAIGKLRAAHPARIISEKCVEAGAAAQVDAFGAMHPGDQGTHLCAEHGGQRRRLRFDQHDGDTAGTETRRQLAADKSRTHHERRRGIGQFGAQRGGVGMAAQHVNARQVGQAGQAARAQAGGDDQLVVGQRAVVGQPEPTRFGVDADGLGVQPQVDVFLGEELTRPQRGVIGFAAHELLGQRRTVVRQPRLVADEDQLALVAGATQLLRGAQAREAGPDDHDRRSHAAILSLKPDSRFWSTCEAHPNVCLFLAAAKPVTSDPSRQ